MKKSSDPNYCVRVTAEDVGGRVRLIGHAWIAGKPWEALAVAIEAVEENS